MTLKHPCTSNLELRGIIFDRDGTLLDLDATWGRAMTAATLQVCKSTDESNKLAAALGLNLETKTFLPDSPTPSASLAETYQRISSVVDAAEYGKAVRPLAAESVEPAKRAKELLEELNKKEIPLALATNDGESSAIAMLKQLDWAKYFLSVKGCDSGFGSKPNPGMLIASAEELGIEKKHLLMVGDSSADLLAASAAEIPYIHIGKHPEGIPEQAEITLEKLEDMFSLLALEDT